jgi:hypothetical protein
MQGNARGYVRDKDRKEFLLEALVHEKVSPHPNVVPFFGVRRSKAGVIDGLVMAKASGSIAGLIKPFQ